MAYENTMVSVPRSQEGIRKLILNNGGSAVAFVSQPPSEGFEAQVVIDGQTYRVRIKAEVRVQEPKRRRRSYRGRQADPGDRAEREARRVWRVLLYHLKGVYEASRSGVMEFRELMLPYIVLKDNRTMAEHQLPELRALVSQGSQRLLSAASSGGGVAP